MHTVSLHKKTRNGSSYRLQSSIKDRLQNIFQYNGASMHFSFSLIQSPTVIFIMNFLNSNLLIKVLNNLFPLQMCGRHFLVYMQQWVLKYIVLDCNTVFLNIYPVFKCNASYMYQYFIFTFSLEKIFYQKKWEGVLLLSKKKGFQ